MIGRKTAILSPMVAAIAATAFVGGCAAPASSGFSSFAESEAGFPAQIPQTVVMVPFTGDVRIAGTSTRRFGQHLQKLGFNVIECERLLGARVLDRFPQTDFIDDATRARLRDKFGADGAALGRVICVEDVSRAEASCEIRLISLQTGAELWKVKIGRDKGLGWSRSTDDLLSQVIDDAALALKKDLKELRANQKRERAQQEKTRKALEKQKRREEKSAPNRAAPPADNPPTETPPPVNPPPETEPSSEPAPQDQPPAEPPTQP